jgi:hypothetical protein
MHEMRGSPPWSLRASHHFLKELVMKKASLKLLFAAAVMVGALVIPAPSKALSGPFGGCNHHGNCPENYDPVICSNGVVYSNACFAGLACATGCVPYGGETE